jgi:uncharacterized membrane protein YccC
MTIKAQLCALADGKEVSDIRETARRLLEPPGLDAAAISERKYQLRKNREPLRNITNEALLQHGQSISLFAEESKGSVGVFYHRITLLLIEYTV